jgi:hypothetical protein
MNELLAVTVLPPEEGKTDPDDVPEDARGAGHQTRRPVDPWQSPLCYVATAPTS